MCDATGVIRHKPSTAIFVVSESPSQAFKVIYRFTCFTAGGEAGYGRGAIKGTGNVTKRKKVPGGNFKKCEVDAAASLPRGASGSMKLTLKGR